MVVPLVVDPVSEVCTAAAVAFQLVWLSTFKVLGMCLCRGPLCNPLNLIQFFAVFMLPITPQAILHSDEKELLLDAPKLLGCCATKALFLGAIVFLLTSPSVRLPRIAQELLYAFGLYAFLGFLMDGPASLATGLIGLQIAPHFDRPFMSSSLSDFWSRRWNLTAGNALRFFVYDVVYEGRLVRDPSYAPALSGARRSLGVAAAFIVSGLMHEYLYLYLMGRATGLWFAFFAVQGPLLWAEGALRRWARARGWSLPRALATPLTLGVLMAIGHALFFPPCTETGLADRVVDNIKDTRELAVD
ncbi:hypothetical protein WJX81_008263 [Elliptochloris bilobata]|uniref:Wax synthase domain-containing protein n=1 Tax=Elliptochloris bilobata TaxID=381761 RepID=A0AAW1RUN4_9CHLO